MSLAEWLGWLLSIPISVVLAWLLAFVLSVPRRIWRAAREVSLKLVWETNLGLPLKCILAIVIHGIFVYLLDPPLLYRTYYYRFLAALLVACFAWLVSRIADRGFEHEVNHRRRWRVDSAPCAASQPYRAAAHRLRRCACHVRCECEDNPGWPWHRWPGDCTGCTKNPGEHHRGRVAADGQGCARRRLL